MSATTTSFRPSTPSRAGLSPPELSPSRISQSYSIPSSHHLSRNLGLFSPVDQNGSFCFDRQIKSGKVHRRVKNKGAWKPSWKPAFLVLRPNLLSIYQNEDETDLKASITLSDVTAVALVRKAHTENVFGLFSPSKNYHFQGASAKDTADWITAIRAETTTEEDDDIDLLPPKFSHRDVESHHLDEFSDLSADDHSHPALSPAHQPWATKESKLTGPPQVGSLPRSSILQDYSGNEHFTTSHSDFSDTLGSSLPKQSSYFAAKGPTLTPVPSTGQLPSKPERRDDSHATSLPARQAHHAEASRDPERVIRQGYLQILKSYKTGVKGWKSIWVVLRARSLAFYKNDQEYAAIKIFNMDTIINAAEIDPISRSKKSCFQIIMEDKSYRFCAPDEEELAKWLGALKSVLTKRQAAVKAKAKDTAKAVALNQATAALSLG
ncbi:hypothetical protein B0A52_04767 [Exophiala mesophila]|uniref:PH domain-containing protein n=1 Tax=Exophiala mesophila TaxID=212818 RepID=A0A438N5Z3_EXOME|nr:hypothetical protein B0A52_04767 [Exophiala mesophila]